MASKRRLLIGAAVAALAVVGVAAIAAPLLLDLERHRGRIEQALRQATGWEASLGEIDFSVLRGLVLSVHPASLAAPEGDSRFDIDSIRIEARVLPLFRGRLEIGAIELVRPRIELVKAEDAWVVPSPGAGPGEAAPAGDDEGGLVVSIESIEITGGSLVLEDRSVDPPRRLAAEDLSLQVHPDTLDVRGGARLGENRGALAFAGNATGGLTLDLVDIDTSALAPFVGPDVIRPGGTLSGTIDVAVPLAISGNLTASDLLLLAGETPLDRADLTFAISTEGDVWSLDRLELRHDEVRLTGSGTLLPDVALDLDVPSTGLEPALRTTRAIFPMPIDLEAPGSARAHLRLDLPAGGELTYRADGEITAAGFVLAEFLPKAEDLRAEFALAPEGSLTVRVVEGRAASGPLAGNVTLDSLSPIGTLTFTGGLKEAVLGELLAGFVDAAERITGPAGVDAVVKMNLASPTLDASALGGGLSLDARDISLPGWDLEAAVREKLDDKLGKLGLASSPGDAPSKAASSREALETISMKLDLDRIPWTLETLELAASGVTASGSGTFDPVSGGIDASFRAVLSPARTRELVDRYRTLEVLVAGDRLTLPMRVRGALTAPSIDVDLDEVLRGKLAGEDPKDAVKGLLKNLLKKK